MILNLFSYYNRLIGQYEAPQAVPHAKEIIAESVICAIKTSDHKLDNLLEMDLYYFGTYDTKTGEIKQEKELLISITKEQVYGTSE